MFGLDSLYSSARLFAVFLAIAAILGMPSFVHAENTELKILVRASDAKFIGSGVGGLNVVLTNAETGALLAEGQITGGTGNTEALMKTGQTRGRSPESDEAASFQAQLDLQRPTRVRVSVTGPLNVEQSIQTVSNTLWVLPGIDVVDPGLVMHMPGLIVALAEHSVEGREVAVTAEVTMICGCPLTKDGLWDSDNFTTVAQLSWNDKVVSEQTLEFTGEKNRFAGQVTAPDAGDYVLTVYAHQAGTGNTGVYERHLVVQ